MNYYHSVAKNKQEIKSKKVLFIRYVFLWPVIIFLGLLWPTNKFHEIQADGPTIVINELMWMGSSASSADEWIELRNVTDQAIDISGWTLTKKSSGADVLMLTIPQNRNIPPGGILVISNYVNTSASSVLNVVPDIVMTDVALSNTSLQIKLFDATQKLIDAADDGAGNPMAGTYDSAKKIYATMERNPVPGDGTQSQNWHTASRGVGFKANAVELGTPSATNSNGVPTAHAGSDQTGIVGQEINFDGSDSFDSEMQPLTYSWNFGDGATSVEATPKHVYNTAGVYNVTLTVSDGVDTAGDSAKVTVSGGVVTAPTPTTPASATATAGKPGTTPPTLAVTSCLGLHFSEIYPNPPGVDNNEFIELVNDGDEEVTTGVCAVFSSATRSYKITVGTVIARGAFLLLPKSQTHLTLNNGGTTVRLVDSDGTELDNVVYGTAKEGMAWTKVKETWSWTSKPTPNGVNVLETPVVKTAAAVKSALRKTKTTATKKTVTVVKPAEPVTLNQLQELDSSDRVVVRGIVTVPRDSLGSTFAYIQNDDGGTSVAIPNGEPTVKLGQTIEVTGTVRLKNGRRYVAVAAKGVKIISTATAPTPSVVATDDVGADQADQLVHVKGVVSLASGNKIEIDDGSGPVPIYIKSSTGIVRPKVKAGDTVEAVGIVSASSTGIRILPRAQDDIHVEKVLGASTVAPTQIVTAPAASKTQTMWYWGLVILGGLASAIRPLWKKWKSRKSEDLD